MDVAIHEIRGKITPKVKAYLKDPNKEGDWSLWVIDIVQGKDRFSMTFTDYDSLHTFAATLMNEAASARP